MRIIAKKTLAKFWENESMAYEPLQKWYKTVTKAAWTNHNELKAQFGNASIINNKRVVFNIHGNKYRLIIDVEYEPQYIFIVWVGTHSDYDKINVENVSYKRSD